MSHDTHEMIEDLIKEQSQLINESISKFEIAPLRQLANSIAACKGVIVFTGVGKSGFIAHKIAMTFVSCGTKALYLSPTDALHGDIGIVNKEDWVVMLSRSGESDELLELMPYLRKRGVQVATFVGSSSSRLAQKADLVIHTPFRKELGPLSMVPTTSTAIQLIYGDLLVVAVTKLKGVSFDDYALNHPAGQIGKRLSLRVSDVMLQGASIPKAYRHQLIGELLVELSDKRSGCLVVASEHDELLGMFTDGDLRRGLQQHGQSILQMPIEQVMTNCPRWISSHTLAYDALKQMEEDPKRLITTLPVLQENKLVGLVRLHDLLQEGL